MSVSEHIYMEMNSRLVSSANKRRENTLRSLPSTRETGQDFSVTSPQLPPARQHLFVSGECPLKVVLLPPKWCTPVLLTRVRPVGSCWQGPVSVPQYLIKACSAVTLLDSSTSLLV
ncbi:hypothetical protein P4O66_016095, partial [Electrophorus voltai]